MSHAKKIAENAAWLIVANTAQKAIAFVAFIIIARMVGVTVTGIYFFAISVTSVFVVFADLGLTPVVVREMAADEARGRSALARALWIKFLLVPLTVLATLAYASWSGITGSTFVAIAMACYVMSADSIHLLWYGAIRGRRELRYEAAGMFIGQIMTAVVSIAAIKMHYGVYGLVFALMLGSTWHVLWSMAIAWKLGLSPKKTTGFSTKQLLRAAWPFALAGIFVKVYSYVDTIMLRHMHGDQAVGEYAVAYKLTYALQFVPLAFVAALYPGMSNAAEKDRAALPGLLQGSLRLMMIVAVPLAAVLSALASTLIPFVYGWAFEGSIEPLVILPWVLIPIFLDFPIGSLLNATHRAEKKTLSMGITMIVNVVANALLIPSLGPTGAAISALISFTLLFFFGWFFARRDIDSKAMLMLLAQGYGAAFVTWVAINQLAPAMPPLFAIAFGISFSIAMLFAFALISKEDVQTAFVWLQKRISSPPPEDEALHEEV